LPSDDHAGVGKTPDIDLGETTGFFIESLKDNLEPAVLASEKTTSGPMLSLASLFHQVGKLH
jgi:hypothetical protein